jgi:hypothetical protein
MSVPVATSRLKAIHSPFVSWNMKSSGKSGVSTPPATAARIN